jgi:hypothetical protein
MRKPAGATPTIVRGTSLIAKACPMMFAGAPRRCHNPKLIMATGALAGSASVDVKTRPSGACSPNIVKSPGDTSNPSMRLGGSVKLVVPA